MLKRELDIIAELGDIKLDYETNRIAELEKILEKSNSSLAYRSESFFCLEIDKIFNQDCIGGMKSFPDESVDLIVTDPPYKLTARGSSGTMSGYWTNDITKKGKVFENNDVEIEDYLGEFYRILKDTSHCYIMCNNLNLPHFFEVISKSKFNFVKLLVWDKCTKICGKYYMGQVEHIFLLKRHFIGYEITKEYFDIAQERIKQEQMQLKLF